MEQHGVFVTQVPTSVRSSAPEQPTIPVTFGTAPVNLSTRSAAPVNVPVLCNTYDEAVAAFGYSDNWANFTLCESMDAFFKLYGQAPAVFINVMDPTAHKTTVAPVDLPVSSGVAVVNVEGVLSTGIIVKSSDGATTYDLDTDYTTGYNVTGKMVITAKSGGAIPTNAAVLKVGYDKLDPAAVTSAEIIGGTDSQTGVATGLELINQIFPRLGLVPNLILAPGYSQDPVVAAVMSAKGNRINGHFEADVLVDLDVEAIDQYADAVTWKAANHYTAANQIPGYPFINYAGKTYHYSTHLAAIICRTDAENAGIPYVSPSNKLMQADSTVQKGGADLFLGSDQASYLNAQGIMTALNFIGGWRSFGNRTGAFPVDTDPVNAFIPIRRMFNWMNNQIVLRYWKNVDDPLNKKLIETVTDDTNIWINGLQASGALVGGRVEFLAAENPQEDLMNGKLKFHLFVTPPGPAQEFDFLIEYDRTYLGSLTS